MWLTPKLAGEEGSTWLHSANKISTARSGHAPLVCPLNFTPSTLSENLQTEYQFNPKPL